MKNPPPNSPPALPEMLARARVVLKDTTESGNIGSAARAMKTMGLSQLFLVSPEARIDGKARARAARADDILDGAKIVPETLDAAGDSALLFALTARRRVYGPPALSPREAARLAVQHLRACEGGGSVAFLFGGESAGLNNDDVRLAHHIIEIDANPDYRSLNLAQAVQIVCYELRAACAEVCNENSPSPRADVESEEMPTPAYTDAMYAHWQRVFSLCELGPPQNPRPLLPKLRRLLARARPNLSEVNLLRGILTAVERTLHENRAPSNSPGGARDGRQVR